MVNYVKEICNKFDWKVVRFMAAAGSIGPRPSPADLCIVTRPQTKVGRSRIPNLCARVAFNAKSADCRTRFPPEGGRFLTFCYSSTITGARFRDVAFINYQILLWLKWFQKGVNEPDLCSAALDSFANTREHART